MSPRPALEEPLRERFVDVIGRRLGLQFGPHRHEALAGGVARAATDLGLGGAEALLERLERGEEAALVAVADTLTVGETYFFRDPQHFALLRRLLEAAEAPVVLWSAGCAGGAEPYTMAILALEVFGDRAAERVSILATDLSEHALAQAREGRYRPWAFRGVDPAVKARWFEPDQQLHRVIAPVRDLVRFARLNLVDAGAPGWPSGVDVVFCRNVLVYFGPEAIAEAARGLRRALTPHGWLITGPSDPLLTTHGLVVDASGGFIAYRRRDEAVGASGAGDGGASDTGAVAEAPPPLEPAPWTSAPPLEPAPWASAPPVEPPAPPSAPAPPADRAAPPDLAPAPMPAAPDADSGVAGSERDPTFHAACDLADRGDTASALALLVERARRAPLDLDLYLLRATLRQAVGDHRGAVEDCRRALLLDRDVAYAHVVAAPSLLALGDRPGARRSVRNARVILAGLAPEAQVRSPGSTSAAELLAACVQLERALTREARRG